MPTRMERLRLGTWLLMSCGLKVSAGSRPPLCIVNAGRRWRGSIFSVTVNGAARNFRTPVNVRQAAFVG
jgi:hypothetical protein